MEQAAAAAEEEEPLRSSCAKTGAQRIWNVSPNVPLFLYNFLIRNAQFKPMFQRAYLRFIKLSHGDWFCYGILPGLGVLSQPKYIPSSSAINGLGNPINDLLSMPMSSVITD
jgi:hypothetical protein